MMSLYVHIPFCQRKCFYCSFVVSVGQEKRIDDYLECLSIEAKRYNRIKIKTVYFGGGTPTLLNEKQLNMLFNVINENFILDYGCEITIEANPENIDPQRLQLLKRQGVNRISLGVQSLHDDYLKYLGRNHNAKKAADAFQIIRNEGFSNVNLDLMFSFPQQTMEDLKEDVGKILAFKSDHLSLYALTVEQNSRFFTRKIDLLDNDVQVKQYQFVVAELKNNGFRQYEVSNFAKPGKESKHNYNYWFCENYIGLGVGAHSHINGRRYWNVSKLTEYINFVNGGKSSEEGEEFLNANQRFMEALLFGLRMNDGICVSDLEKRFQSSLEKKKRHVIENLIEEKFLVEDKGVLKATSKGFLVLDEISAKLI